jgi:membrane protease YdiL (CAAX protease family)
VIANTALPGGRARATRTETGLLVVASCAGLLALAARAAVLSHSDGRVLVISVPLVLGAIALVAPAVPAPARQVVPAALVSVVGLAGVAATSALGPSIPLAHTTISLGLVVVAALGEELFFRRLLYGTLERWGVAAAIVGSAALFAAVHMPLYGAGVFWVDLGAGLVFSWQRWASGGWAAPAATHAIANIVATIR